MRIDLLFGFLGSGKTTLARRILEEWGPRERLALIVNEFGDVGVDGAILQGNDIDLVELSSGCLCCTLKGSLLNAIEELGARAPLDHIVIEATGVAEPEEMIATFADPSFHESYELGPITTVVDAAKFAKIKFALGPFFTSQIAKADMLVLNKVDLADSETLEETRRQVRETNAQAMIRFADHGDIDIGELMQGPPSQVAQRYAGAAGDGHAHADHEHDHEHRHAPADSCVLDAAASVSRSDLEAFFAEAPEDLWRSKGFLLVDGAPKLVQFTMGQLEISDAEPRDRYYLVLIGRMLDRTELKSRFEALAAAGAAA